MPGVRLLPRFLVLGPTGGGKSTFLAAAGAASDAHADARGWPGCEAYESPEARFIELAGPCFDGHADDTVRALGRRLRRARESAGVDGAVLVVPADALLPGADAPRAAIGERAQACLASLGDALGGALPVYLVVTRMDRVPGFAGFFATFNDSERQQVWGSTLPRGAGPPFAPRVSERMEELGRGLVQLRVDKLASTSDPAQKLPLFTFPLEFAALEPALARLVARVFDVEHDRAPPLRGIYFGSAHEQRQGAPGLVARIAERYAVSPTPSRIERAEGLASFLRRLPGDVLVPDAEAHRAPAVAARSPRHVFALAAGLLAVVAIIVAFTVSFVANLGLVDGVADDVRAARAASADREDLLARFATLDVLQNRVEQLGRYRTDGLPLRLGFGLYQGERLRARLRDAYFDALRGMLLAPVTADLERALSALDARTRGPDAIDEGYKALKTYLMLTEAHRGDAEVAHLREQVLRHWQPWLERQRGPHPLEDVLPLAARQAAYFAEQIREPDAPHVEPREALVQSARRTLNEAIRLSPAIDRVYGRLKAACSARVPAVPLSRLIGARDAELLVAGQGVPGCFTRDGWAAYFEAAVQEASAGEVVGGDWVLASTTRDDLRTSGSPETIRKALIALYAADYAETWRRFLAGVSLARAGSYEAGVRALGALAEPATSPVVALLRRAAVETGWGAMASEFAPLAPLVSSSAANAPLERYHRVVARVRSRLADIPAGRRGEAGKALLQTTVAGGGDLNDGVAFVDQQLLPPLGAQLAAALRPLLVRPFTLAARTLVPPAAQSLNDAWASNVHALWSASLAGRFPFADVPAEASPANVAQLLAPADGRIARFRDREVGALVTRSGDAFVAREWNGVGIAFRPEFLALLDRMAVLGRFVGNGERLRFDLRPEPTPELTEILLTVDGATLRYRNEPQEWQVFGWPATGAVAPGASLRVQGVRGASETVASYPGAWGFVRMLAAAQTRPIDRTLHQLAWRTSQGYLVRYTMRVEPGVTPFPAREVRQVSVPRRVAD